MSGCGTMTISCSNLCWSSSNKLHRRLLWQFVYGKRGPSFKFRRPIPPTLWAWSWAAIWGTCIMEPAWRTTALCTWPGPARKRMKRFSRISSISWTASILSIRSPAAETSGTPACGSGIPRAAAGWSFAMKATGFSPANRLWRACPPPSRENPRPRPCPPGLGHPGPGAGEHHAAQPVRPGPVEAGRGGPCL